MNATEFERSLTRLMSQAMPHAAPLNPAREPDDELAATMMAELVNALAVVIGFTAGSDPKAVDMLLEGATERLYAATVHHTGNRDKLTKAIRLPPRA
jgi:hypothetical protein